jgi:protein-S-isoprenylcysteine O-methyltransferase Ste14
MAPPRALWSTVPPEQLPWVMAGKWYLLARFALHVVLVGSLAGALSSGRVGVSIWSFVGVAVLACGYGLRRWARAVLGERFRSFEVRREARGLERGGPYAYMRHPGYVGLGLMDAALPFALGLPWLAPLSAIPIAILVRRARLESDLLSRVYR